MPTSDLRHISACPMIPVLPHFPDLEMSEYRARHGDPDITRYRHACQLCGLRLTLNSGVARKHFLLKHQVELEAYMLQFRNHLLREKMVRPVLPSTHTLGMCVYQRCQLKAVFRIRILFYADPDPT
jgi:hypothetical protein